jgi:hypothetical protein
LIAFVSLFVTGDEKTMFSELIRKKEAILRRLYLISVRQLEIVRRSDITALIQHLGQKQRVIDEFEEVESQLAPYRDAAPEKRKWKNETERLETAAAVERCAIVLREIIQNDTTSTEEVAAQRHEFETQLRQLRQSSKVISAYTKNS